MAEKIEYDLTVNGKQAKKSIEDVEKAQDGLADTTKTSNNEMSRSWVTLGTKIAAVSATAALLVKSGADLDKMMFGLNQTTKDYIKQASSQYGVNQKIIASYVQTGKSAGMSGDAIKEMIDQAVALGRLYPNESTESFIDNLSMLNTTGEAQGYIVDVLEQKWGAIDLKGKTLAEKMELLREKTKGVNEEFAKTQGAEVDKSINTMTNAFSDLGTELLSLVNDTGAFYAFNKAVAITSATLSTVGAVANKLRIGIKSVFGGDVEKDMEDHEARLDSLASKWDKVLGKIEKPKPSPVEQKVKDDSLGIKGNDTIEQVEVERRIAAEKAKRDAIIAAEKEVKALREQFSDDHIQSILSDTEYEIYKLSEKYLEYSKHVQDKKALDEWFTKEHSKILDKQRENSKEVSSQIASYFEDTFATKLTDALLSGEASFKDFANAIISDIARIIIRQQIANAVAGVMGGGLFAQGGVVGGESPVQKRFATGGIVNRPTRFANGGMVGERNRAEAILPLERTANGDLGVKAGGGGSNVVVNIENQTGSNIDASDIVTSSNQEQETINIVLKGISKNTSGIRDLLKGM